MNLTKVVVYLEQPGDAFNCEQIGLCNLHLGGEMSLRTSLLKNKPVSEKSGSIVYVSGHQFRAATTASGKELSLFSQILNDNERN